MRHDASESRKPPYRTRCAPSSDVAIRAGSSGRFAHVVAPAPARFCWGFARLAPVVVGAVVEDQSRKAKRFQGFAAVEAIRIRPRARRRPPPPPLQICENKMGLPLCARSRHKISADKRGRHAFGFGLLGLVFARLRDRGLLRRDCLRVGCSMSDAGQGLIG